MRDITKIDISKITRTGKYVDFENTELYTLTPEEVKALRRFHKNPNIARDYDFDMRVKERVRISEPRHQERDSLPKEYVSSRHYALAKDRNKYNHHYQTKKPIKIKYGWRLLMGSLVVILSGSILLSFATQAANRKNFPISTYETSADDKNNSPKPLTPTNLDTDNMVFTGIHETELKQNDEFSYEREIITKYSNIYHINSDLAFKTIASLTDNFSSEDYLANYHIPGVTCKGEEAYASSEEEILLYAVRAIKQLPENFGVPTDNLYTNNSYHSSNNYCAQISYISKLMGVNRCLVYAICKTECDFNSELFLNSNNPAGIRSDDSWWEFDTTEEGFIETCVEIKKYYRLINKPLSDISYNTLAEVGAIHAPISDGNELWLDTVWEIYNDAINNEEELFGDTNPNNRLSK